MTPTKPKDIRPMHYPFAALVGQEQLKTALLLAAVDPHIGGVLVCGEKGTAKSTAARALAALLPRLSVVAGCPFHCDPAAIWVECPHCGDVENRRAIEIPMPRVDLPLGATEDRVLGTLDFEQALREGRKALQPGLLASAHRGILYIDEVNLLSDHLVDVLLDAAAMGMNSVQREGIELVHPARFVLIGTMNPEEGELRPQLLDRFGLMVRVAAPREPSERAEIVRRRLAYEASPSDFAARWAADEAALRTRVARASELLPRVHVEDSLLELMTSVCCNMEVDGLRGDIVLYKTARAMAALDQRTVVTSADVTAAAELALAHRRRRRSRETPSYHPPEADRSSPEPPAPETASSRHEPRQNPSSTESAADHEDSRDGASQADEMPTRIFPLPPPEAVRPIELTPMTKTDPLVSRGRRNQAATERRGQYVRATADESPSDLAIDATLRAAAQRGAWSDGKLTIERGDLRQKQRSGRTGTLILFVVDASGSMAARRRMEAVKGTVLGLLVDAYHQRDQVAVISVRGAEAELLLPPTGSVQRAEEVLQSLPTGGRTPLAHALTLAGEVAGRTLRSAPDTKLLLVLLTDGKANVCLPATNCDPFQQALDAAAWWAAEALPALVLDTDSGYVRVGRAKELAAALGAEYLPLEELSADSLMLEIQQRRHALMPTGP
jgi:magnesium chelatase subunit D